MDCPKNADSSTLPLQPLQPAEEGVDRDEYAGWLEHVRRGGRVRERELPPLGDAIADGWFR
jgi:hypothetical protein